MAVLKQHKAENIPFHFHGNLCDFLPKQASGLRFYPYLHPTTVKDAIEALGVPHVEVGTIRIHEKEVTFLHLLQPTDNVAVYPFYGSVFSSPTHHLRPLLNKPVRFISDVHLGSLSRLLRLAGFDTYYKPGIDDGEIAQIAVKEERIVLTRDIGLLKHKIIHWGYWLRSQHRDEQFFEVAQRFDLWSSFNPFSHCLACNGQIEPVAKVDILNKLPSNAARYFDTFYQCQNCLKIYWKGSHYDHMIQTLERIRNQNAA